MDYVKDISDELHDAIQQSVDCKGVEGSGMQTPPVSATPVTARTTRRTERANPTGPEQGNISSLTEGGSSSAMARGAVSQAAPLMVLSLDYPAFSPQWKQVFDAGDDPTQTINAMMKGAKKRVLINELGPKWNDPAAQ
eukprot:962762-Rhodomonas_salina.1